MRRRRFPLLASPVRKPRPWSKRRVGRSVEQLKAIRDWAGKNGFDVSPRGRIKADVVDAFDAAH
ncbi:Lsr2 family DNA-binding protein [Rhodococcus sp. YL-1]